MNIFKKILKTVTSIIPGGGIVQSIISPDKTPEQVKAGLSTLDPIAQYNRTMARPRIALSSVYVYLGMTVCNWFLETISQLFKFTFEAVPVPSTVQDFATIAVGFYMGSRGVEKVFDKIFKKKTNE